MNEKALKTLEYNKIIQMLSSYAVSARAKEMALLLKPSSDLKTVQQWQEETADASSFLLRYGSIPLGGLKDVREALKRTAFGGILSSKELLEIGQLLYVTAKVKKYASRENEEEQYETLEPLFGALVPIPALEREINRCILSEQDIADDASGGLRATRRDIKVSNDRIKDQLNSIIHSNTYKNMLQDPVVTMRGGRYCVPVKQEYRNSFNGMIHDQSATGATVFMEPMAVVNLNNRIKELEAKEKEEIEKILAALSAEVNEHSQVIESNLELLVQIDFIFAKGNLALSMKACKPVFNDKIIDIKKARHPLLDADKVVPTDINLGDGFTSLLITGPNTGGKTVFLKTIGLFSMMGQAGLHIPSFDNPVLALFDEIFADIGDEQSIEQNLSTFSSHISNIVSILKNVTDQSLVLFDELGAGTDPTEGAALAMAIISLLHERKIMTVVTTHYSELKVFALSTEGIENGSCEFDVNTLKPTYKFLIGIPGKSNAFAIARRIGIEQDVIERAKAFISREDARLEDVITDLEISKKTAIAEKERGEQFRLEAERLKMEIQQQKEKLSLQREKVLLEAKKEAHALVKEAYDEAEGLIKEIRKTYEEKGSIQDIELQRKRLKEKVSETYEESAEKRVKGKTPEFLAAGDRVFVVTFNQIGSVVSPPDKNGEVCVQMGIMKVNIHLSQLEAVEEGEPVKKQKIATSFKARRTKSMTVKNEIDLRGQTVEEALENADKYLDDAYLSGLKQVSIIHGKGTGVLREAVGNYLRRHPHVVSYRLGEYGEGDTGVTVAELK